MNKLYILVATSLIFPSLSIFAQQDTSYIPNGKPEIRIFTSASSTFFQGENFNKFDLNRAYLGYIQNFTKTLTGRVTLDFGNPSAGKLNYTAYLKFAYLQYHIGKFFLTGGMIPLPHYEVGDTKWGYRYVYRTFFDDHGFGTSADLGISVVYKFTPRFGADLTLVNGEGFKLAETDSAVRVGLGITLIPVKNLTLRGFFDTMKKEEVNQQTTELMASYENRKIAVAYGWYSQKDHALVADHDYQGMTLNASLLLKKNVKIFARFDDLTSEKTGNAQNPWNYAKDGRLYLAGIEIPISPGIKLSPNFMCLDPADASIPSSSRISLNLDVKY